MSEQTNPASEQESTEDVVEDIVEVVSETVVEEDGVTVIEKVTVDDIVEEGEVVAEVVETVETVIAEDAETDDVLVEETVDDVLVVGDEVVAEVIETTETLVSEDAETGEVVIDEIEVDELIVGDEVVAADVSETVIVEDAIADGEVRIRKVEGPSNYTPQEFRGRVRRVGNDARLADIHYKNIPLLTRFLDPRGRILARRKIRVSAKVQRRAAKAIKRARHLALLPYTGEHTRITRKHR